MGKLLGGHYQFIKVLGFGELGQTYLAADVRVPTHPKCVIKQIKLPTKNLNTLKFILSFLTKKAKILEKLGKHPQIPQMLSYFAQEQDFYLVQEFIPGEALTAELLPSQPMTETQVISLFQDVLDILVFVHKYGAIHRCIKPSNIIRRQTDGKLILTDLGIVKEVSSQMLNPLGKLEQTRATEAYVYIPPEQSQGKLQFNSDLYALGMVGIQALTGLSTNDLANLKRTSESMGKTIVWRDRTPVSSQLAALIDKMIDIDPHQRYQTAAAVLADLQKILNSNTVTASSSPPNSAPLNSVSQPLITGKNWFQHSQRIASASANKKLVFSKNKNNNNNCRIPSLILTTTGAIIVGMGIFFGPQLSRTLLAESSFNQGETQEQAGETQEAIEHYTKAIQLQPINSTAYFRRGMVYSSLGSYESALADLTEAIQLNPNDAKAYYQRGNIRLHIGDRQGAKTDYTQAIQLRPNLTVAYINRGKIEADLGNDSEAVRDYTQAIELNPHQADAYLHRCLSRSNLGDQRSAIDDCTQAINLRPNHSLAYQNRGLARHRRGNIRGAIEDYNVAIQLNPDKAEPFYNRGLARQELGDNEGAIADYTQAIERNPNHALVYYHQALAHIELNNQQQAIQDLQQAAQLCLNQNRLTCYKDAQDQLNQLESE